MESQTFLAKLEQVFHEKAPPLQIHTEGFTSFLVHPDEAYLSFAFRFGMLTQTKLPLQTPEYEFCETMLKKVSRSFALVIQTLPDDLRISVCIFYLILRALDTIEDDVTSLKSNKPKKMRLCKEFASYLNKPSWSNTSIGEGDEKILLENFSKVLTVYHGLPKKDQVILYESCKEMGEGMAEFLKKNIRLGTATIAEYNLYCHYVAGIVGQGLTRLFVSHGYEGTELLNLMKEADEMGMFLQKTNIIRDYLEDIYEGRTFWPQQIWQKYTKSLLDLRLGDKEKSVECLNEMVVDAYSHVPAVLRYLQQIKDPKVFKFCAIPQVMAIATLERIVNNPDVFTGIVKIRKGLMLSLFQYTSSMEEVKGFFSTYSDAILSNIPLNHAAHKEIIPLVYEVQGLCVDGVQPSKPWPSILSLFISLSILIYGYLQGGNRNWIDLLLLLTMMIFMIIKKIFRFSAEIWSKGSS